MNNTSNNEYFLYIGDNLSPLDHYNELLSWCQRNFRVFKVFHELFLVNNKIMFGF